LYAGWGIVGRGKRAATAALFNSGGASPIRNPNPEQTRQGAGWNTEHMMTLYDLGVPIDGGRYRLWTGCVSGCGARAIQQSSNATGWAHADSVAAGVRIDKRPPGQCCESPLANPVLAGGNRQFLLAFEQEDAAGRRQIWAKIVKAE
jgi:hypothetical protein